jgi:hypothetical protein
MHACLGKTLGIRIDLEGDGDKAFQAVRTSPGPVVREADG